MDKSLIVKFIKEKKRGVYNAITDEYSLIIMDDSPHVSLLKNVIEIDLEKHTGEEVKLNYFSLWKAMKKFKKRNPPGKKDMNKAPMMKKENPRYDFKDSHELEEKNIKPGSFKLK